MQLVLLDLGSCNFKVVCVYRATVHKGSIRAVYASAINVPSYLVCVCSFIYGLCIYYIYPSDEKRKEGEEKRLRPRESQFLAFQLHCNTKTHEQIARTSRFKKKRGLRAMHITIDRCFLRPFRNGTDSVESQCDNARHAFVEKFYRIIYF